ncbi:MAG TPA: transposase [Gemmataceae bacterium]|jgi:hypothetical protein|nr:transposase [Gemmataceae bacterium]
MALDLGRYKSVVCFSQWDTRHTLFRTIETTPEVVRELCAEYPMALVIVEPCANAGLVPKQYQSGVTDRKGRITRRGPRRLRKLLVECAGCMLRYNG